MGKGWRRGHQAGWSAAAKGARAGRARARQRLVSASLFLVAVALAGMGVVMGDVQLLVGALAAAIVAWWIRPDADPDRWVRGADGEMATASMLDALPRRFVVLHDRRLPGWPGNIDHLVIGPSGVWVVDSKARRARLRIRRGQVWAGDHPVDPRPAARQSEAVGRVLGTQARAVLAVHGRGLRRRGKVVTGVRILPADRVIRTLRHGRRLSRRQVNELADRADQLLLPCP